MVLSWVIVRNFGGRWLWWSWWWRRQEEGRSSSSSLSSSLLCRHILLDIGHQRAESSSTEFCSVLLLYIERNSFPAILWYCLSNRPYRLFTFDPIASFSCGISHHVSCTIHLRIGLWLGSRSKSNIFVQETWDVAFMRRPAVLKQANMETRPLGQKWINCKVYWISISITIKKLRYKRTFSPCVKSGVNSLLNVPKSTDK